MLMGFDKPAKALELNGSIVNVYADIENDDIIGTLTKTLENNILFLHSKLHTLYCILMQIFDLEI